MNPRTTLILALVAGALGVFVYFYEIAGQPEREATERETKALFPGLEAGEIEEIALRTPEGVDVVARRGAGRWQLVEPVAFRADDLVLDGLADTLAELTSERTLENPQPLADYELREEGPAVRFVAGGREHGLSLGGRAPLGGSRYATVLAPTQDGKVVLLPRAGAQAFERSLDDLREKRVLDFEAEEVRTIAARWPDGSVVLARDDAAAPFRLTEPSPYASDQRRVEELLSTLAFLRAEGFEDSPGVVALDSFRHPAFEITLELEGGESRQLALSELDSGGRRLAKTPESESTLFLLRPEILEELPREVVDYRFKELVRFDSSQASEIEIVFEEPDLESAREVRVVEQEGGWAGSPNAWGPGMADAFVRVLAELDASDIAAEAMGKSELATLGLDPAWVTIRVRGGDESLAELRLGQADSERGVLAMVPGRETVYRIDYVVGARIPISYEAYLNRFAAPEESGEEPGAAEEARPLE